MSDTTLQATFTVKNYTLSGSLAIATSGTGAWTALTSGSTEITAAAGKKITVVELNAAAASGGLVVSAGVVASVPKAS